MRAFNQSKPMNVNREKIIAKLKKNRDAHVEEFEVSLKAWKEKSMAALKQRAALFNSVEAESDKCNLDFGNLPKPRCYKKEYDDAIGYLELSEDEQIELTVEQYQVFFNDEWNWMGGFKAVSMSYAG